jgi:NAD(P)-dependent dehydrogenase (short-subunit alcohol dehydrogenase family)
LTGLDDLAGRSSLVTGGSAGIGLEIVDLMRRLGSRVGVIDTAAAPTADAYACADVSDPAATRDAVRGLAEDLGGVDILINNAGIAPAGDFERLSEEEWQRTVGINLGGVFHCTQTCLPYLRDSGSAAVVNIGSIAGRSYSRTASAAYAASKGGVIAMTRQLAFELSGDGIRVNCVCPGLVDTGVMARNTDPARLSALVATIPLGRLAAPAEIASTVCFLASDASSYLTGAIIDVTGGLQ